MKKHYQNKVPIPLHREAPTHNAAAAAVMRMQKNMSTTLIHKPVTIFHGEMQNLTSINNAALPSINKDTGAIEQTSNRIAKKKQEELR